MTLKDAIDYSSVFLVKTCDLQTLSSQFLKFYILLSQTSLRVSILERYSTTSLFHIIVVWERETFYLPTTTWSRTGGELISLTEVLTKAWYKPLSAFDTLRTKRLPLAATDSLGLDEERIAIAFLYQVQLPTDTWQPIVTFVPIEGLITARNPGVNDGMTEM